MEKLPNVHKKSFPSFTKCLENENSNLRHDMQKLREENQILKNKCADSLIQSERSEERIRNLREKVGKGEDTIEAQKKEIEKLKLTLSKNSSGDKIATAVKQNLEKVKAELNEYKEKYNRNFSENKQLTEKCENMEGVLRKLNNNLVDKCGQISTLENSLAIELKNVAQKQVEINELNSDIKALKELNSKSGLDEKNNGLKKKISDLEKELENKTIQIKNDRSKTKEMVASLNSVIKQYRKQLDDSKQEIKELQSAFEITKADLTLEVGASKEKVKSLEMEQNKLHEFLDWIKAQSQFQKHIEVPSVSDVNLKAYLSQRFSVAQKVDELFSLYGGRASLPSVFEQLPEKSRNVLLPVPAILESRGTTNLENNEISQNDSLYEELISAAEHSSPNIDYQPPRKKSRGIHWYKAERNFQCQMCPKKFQYLGYLKRHLEETHSMPDAFEKVVAYCDCGRLFNDKAEAIQHKGTCSQSDEFHVGNEQLKISSRLSKETATFDPQQTISEDTVMSSKTSEEDNCSVDSA